MSQEKMECDTCEMRGYSAYFCRLHAKITKQACRNYRSYDSIRRVGKTAALGAGAGVAATVVGIGVAPVLGIKAAIGHVVAAKLTAGGGVAGAWANVCRKAIKGQSEGKPGKKKRILLPRYLKRS